MICKRIRPSLLVRQYIREYLLIHLVFDKAEAAPIKSYPVNPKTGITFQFRGHLIAETQGINTIENRPAVNIFGIPSARQNFILTNEFMLVNVEFQPMALAKFLGIPLVSLDNGSLDASLIAGREINEVNEQLSDAKTYDAIPGILDAYFIKKINQLRASFRPVDSIAKIIMDNPFYFNLDKTARDCCMSHRALENIFLQQMGVTPKYYARMSRFYQAYVYKEINPGVSWINIALEYGYTDYQHLVKDCKAFAGVTPNHFIQDVNSNPEKRLLPENDFAGL